jgi:DNA-binding transcriptional MerR regulator
VEFTDVIEKISPEKAASSTAKETGQEQAVSKAAPSAVKAGAPRLATVHMLDREFTAKDAQVILRALTSGEEKIGLALLNYYSRTNLVPCTGKTKSRGRKKYSYPDLVLLCWLFRMKAEGLPVNRFRRGIDYLRKRLPKLHKQPADMVMLTDGKQLFIKHRVEDKGEIAEVLTGKRAGQYVWAYAIGSLIEEVDRIIDEKLPLDEETRVAA